MSGIRRGQRLGAGSEDQDDEPRGKDDVLRVALGLKDPEAPQKLPIKKIRRDGGTQPRASLDPETIQDYAQDMANGDVFPPGIVFYDGADYWLARGFTRTAAAESLGWTEFDYIVKQGTRRDAVLFSVGENADHGLRRTKEDKRRAVMTLLSDPEWRKWSNREIARQCHVDEKTVRNLRDSSLTADNPQLGEMREKSTPEKRTVQRGHETYEMKPRKAPQAPRPKPQPPAPEPARHSDHAEPTGSFENQPAQARGLYRPSGSAAVPVTRVTTEVDDRNWIIDQLRRVAGLMVQYGRDDDAKTSIQLANKLVKEWVP